MYDTFDGWWVWGQSAYGPWFDVCEKKMEARRMKLEAHRAKLGVYQTILRVHETKIFCYMHDIGPRF